ncbi:MAG: pirin family protein, partial [Brevundimonas sp.]|nr:pirin family protein [Brevundimonas sp.]
FSAPSGRPQGPATGDRRTARLPASPHRGTRQTAASDAIVLLGHAQPIGEPVFSHGPFVMNTRDEIIQAIEDYNAGKFGPPPKVA